VTGIDWAETREGLDTHCPRAIALPESGPLMRDDWIDWRALSQARRRLSA
jgi:hypothetical protein